MDERIDQELALLRQHFDEVEYFETGRWVRVAPVPTGPGWNRKSTPVAYQVPVGFPGTPPYGFYVPVGLLWDGQAPRNYDASTSRKLPFEGHWGMFSWTPDGNWRATADVVTGSNLLNWTRSFRDRFTSGA